MGAGDSKVAGDISPEEMEQTRQNMDDYGKANDALKDIQSLGKNANEQVLEELEKKNEQALQKLGSSVFGKAAADLTDKMNTSIRTGWVKIEQFKEKASNETLKKWENMINYNDINGKPIPKDAENKAEKYNETLKALEDDEEYQKLLGKFLKDNIFEITSDGSTINSNVASFMIEAVPEGAESIERLRAGMNPDDATDAVNAMNKARRDRNQRPVYKLGALLHEKMVKAGMWDPKKGFNTDMGGSGFLMKIWDRFNTGPLGYFTKDAYRTWGNWGGFDAESFITDWNNHMGMIGKDDAQFSTEEINAAKDLNKYDNGEVQKFGTELKKKLSENGATEDQQTVLGKLWEFMSNWGLILLGLGLLFGAAFLAALFNQGCFLTTNTGVIIGPMGGGGGGALNSSFLNTLYGTNPTFPETSVTEDNCICQCAQGPMVTLETGQKMNWGWANTGAGIVDGTSAKRWCTSGTGSTKTLADYKGYCAAYAPNADLTGLTPSGNKDGSFFCPMNSEQMSHDDGPMCILTDVYNPEDQYSVTYHYSWKEGGMNDFLGTLLGDLAKYTTHTANDFLGDLAKWFSGPGQYIMSIIIIIVIIIVARSIFK